MGFDSRVSRRDITKTGLAVTGAAIAVSASGNRLFAQEATPVASPEPGLPPLPEGATVIAEGLLQPRNFAWGDDGTLYVTENGVGGDEVLNVPPPGEEPPAATPVTEEAPPVEATPVEEEPPPTRGYTGQITAIAPDGTVSVVASGLASYSIGVGPVGITNLDGEIYFTIGGAGVGVGIEPLPEENTVNHLLLDSGEAEIVAELGPYEAENNPDGTDVNPNLYDLVALTDGTLVVNDAGGNVIYTVDPSTGDFSPLTILPLQEELPEASADPAGVERQVVPTGLAVADDAVFVSLLGEFWPADAPSILSVAEDGTVDPIAFGLQTIVDITVGPDGHMYASSLSANLGGEAGPEPGSVVRVLEDGTVEPVVEGLFFPHGIIFDDEGNLYVSVYALIPGAGVVARFDGIAAPV
jgi:hypothetical protein